MTRTPDRTWFCTGCGNEKESGGAPSRRCPRCGAVGVTLTRPQRVIALPYAGTAGWSGSDTSHERAEREAADGTMAARQTRIYGLLGSAGRNGLTSSEIEHLTGWHHGQASSALSTMHLDGLIARLAAPEERRHRSAPYVLPEHLDERAAAAHGRRNPLDRLCKEWLTPPDLDGFVARADTFPSEFVDAVRALTGYGVHPPVQS